MFTITSSEAELDKGPPQEAETVGHVATDGIWLCLPISYQPPHTQTHIHTCTRTHITNQQSTPGQEAYLLDLALPTNTGLRCKLGDFRGGGVPESLPPHHHPFSLHVHTPRPSTNPSLTGILCIQGPPNNGQPLLAGVQTTLCSLLSAP